MSAEIIDLSSWRATQEADPEIDLETAVDVAVRDLDDILSLWETPTARDRLIECRNMLRLAFERW